MNYRQWKKKYKKEHGHNPHRIKQRTLKEHIETLTKDILKTVNTAVLAVKNSIYNIQNMPEEELIEKLNTLTVEQCNLAWMIREAVKRKVGGYTFSLDERTGGTNLKYDGDTKGN